MSAAKKVTLDDAWEIITELGKAQKESGRELKEAQLELKEAQKETDRQIKETSRELKETSRELKASHERTKESLEKLSESIDKANGNFNQKWGDFLENFIEGDLLNIFKARNIKVKSVHPRVKAYRDDKTIKAEYDFVLANGDEVIVIEVKTTVSSPKLDNFLVKLRNLKTDLPEYSNKKIYGGVAYINASKKLIENAEKYGLFLIQAPGGENKVSLIANPQDFVPTRY